MKITLLSTFLALAAVVFAMPMAKEMQDELLERCK